MSANLDATRGRIEVLGQELSGFATSTEGIRKIKGNTEAAMTRFRELLELDPGNVLAHCNLGVAYERLSDWKNAMATYRRLLTVKPASASFVNERLHALEERYLWTASPS